MKWIIFDLGSTLVDESDVYKSRCVYAVKQRDINLEEFMERVCKEAKTSPTPIRAAADAYKVKLPQWDNSLEKLFSGASSVVFRCCYDWRQT